MGASERLRGARGEREIVEILRFRWPKARRNFGSGSQGGGDITNGPQGVHLEVKFCDRTKIWEWWEQAAADADGQTPVVAFRRSRSGWLALVELDELLALLQLREQG